MSIENCEKNYVFDRKKFKFSIFACKIRPYCANFLPLLTNYDLYYYKIRPYWEHFCLPNANYDHLKILMPDFQAKNSP